MRAQVACFAIALLVSASPETGAQLIGVDTCPQKVEVEQRVTAIPEGWEGGQSTATVPLSSVTFFHGPPAERASLKYDSEDRQKRDRIAFWNLPPSARGYWISCAYENTTTVVARRLPESVRTCSVTYERRKRGLAGLPGIKHISCR